MFRNPDRNISCRNRKISTAVFVDGYFFFKPVQIIVEIVPCILNSHFHGFFVRVFVTQNHRATGVFFITFAISAQIQKGKLPQSAKDALKGGPAVLAGHAS